MTLTKHEKTAKKWVCNPYILTSNENEEKSRSP